VESRSFSIPVLMTLPHFSTTTSAARSAGANEMVR
jgi:hypothetical protein